MTAPKPIVVEIPAERKWTLTVTDDVGFADVWEKGYTEEDSILTITVNPRSHPATAAPGKIGTSPICERCCKDQEPFCIGCYRLQPHNDVIAAQARDKGINELLAVIENRFEDTNRGEGVVGVIRGLAQSLREAKP